MKQIYFYDSPIGVLRITCTKNHLTGLDFATNKKQNPTKLFETTLKCKQELDEYFEGERSEFSIQTTFESGTQFQQKVWNALKDVPYGETTSYQDIATSIDKPKAMRAVGGANNKNPIVIVIPCHRIIGKNGKLVGFGGGLDKKEWLLTHEKSHKKL